jgi:hypothetical protein
MILKFKPKKSKNKIYHFDWKIIGDVVPISLFSKVICIFFFQKYIKIVMFFKFTNKFNENYTM